MNNRLEFVTTKNQYLFCSMIKHIELAFWGTLGTAIANVVFQNDTFKVTTILITFGIIVCCFGIFSFAYVYLKLGFLKSALPKLVISDHGIYLNEFGEEKEFSWNEISKITVTGKFRKSIQLNQNKHSALYQIEYYLFPPEQRRKILNILRSKIET